MTDLRQKKPISFQIIYRFKTGVTLRFPRVEAIRKDKMWYECLSSTELEKLKSVRIKEGVFKSISEERCFNFEFLPPFLTDYLFCKVFSEHNQKGAWLKCALMVESERSFLNCTLLRHRERCPLEMCTLGRIRKVLLEAHPSERIRSVRYSSGRIRNVSLCVQKK